MQHGKIIRNQILLLHSTKANSLLSILFSRCGIWKFHRFSLGSLVAFREAEAWWNAELTVPGRDEPRVPLLFVCDSIAWPFHDIQLQLRDFFRENRIGHLTVTKYQNLHQPVLLLRLEFYCKPYGSWPLFLSVAPNIRQLNQEMPLPLTSKREERNRSKMRNSQERSHLFAWLNMLATSPLSSEVLEKASSTRKICAASISTQKSTNAEFVLTASICCVCTTYYEPIPNKEADIRLAVSDKQTTRSSPSCQRWRPHSKHQTKWPHWQPELSTKERPQHTYILSNFVTSLQSINMR